MGENSGDLSLGYMMGQSEGNNGGGFGNFGEGIWAVIILAILFGNGGLGGFGGFGGGQGAVSSGFAFNTLDNGIRGIQQGLCDGFYSVNTGMLTGFNNLQSQLASCCCETQRTIERGFCDTNYNLATNTRDIIEANNAGVRSILEFLTQDKIATLQAENQSLKFQASQANQNSYLAALSDAQTAELIRRIAPTPVPSYSVPAPYPYCSGGTGYGYGYGTDCGCGC